MENKNNKIIPIIIVLLILVVLSMVVYFMYNKLSSNNADSGGSSANNDYNEKTTNEENENVALENIEYEIVNPKKLGYTDEDQWILIKFDYDKAAETGKTPLDDKVGTINDSLASQINGYEYGFINGYYSNDVFYTSIISDKQLIIKKIDFKNDNKSYDEFVTISMPTDYKLCGLWEGTRQNNDCSATILYMNEKNMYIHTVGENFTEDIYSFNINNKTIRKIDSSYKNGPHSMPRAYKYNKYLILKEDAGLFIIDTTVENNFETIFSVEQHTGEQLSLKNIKNNELYFSLDKTEYDSEQSPNGRKEIHIDYKYNFETKSVNEENKTSNYISY